MPKAELADEDEEARRFDLIMLRLQLALLKSEPAFVRLKKQLQTIAALLSEKSSIPMVAAQMFLIDELQSDAWWEGITAPVLDDARKRLRSLVKLIERAKRVVVYTDFEDELGEAKVVPLSGMGAGVEFDQFRSKARQFLRALENHMAVQKLRLNKPLTPIDVAELERMLLEAGVGTREEIARAKEENQGLGIFIRSLVGLDREAAKQAFGHFLSGKKATPDQIEFIDHIVNHLTQHGVMDAELLYQSPFTDVNPHGPEGVFTVAEVDTLVSVLEEFRRRAVG